MEGGSCLLGGLPLLDTTPTVPYIEHRFTHPQIAASFFSRRPRVFRSQVSPLEARSRDRQRGPRQPFRGAEKRCSMVIARRCSVGRQLVARKLA